MVLGYIYEVEVWLNKSRLQLNDKKIVRKEPKPIKT